MGEELVDVIIVVHVTITNTGEYNGKEVAQVYISKPDTKIDRPNQELKGFAKTKELKPGASEELRIEIPLHDLEYWQAKQGWTLESGTHSISIASSSRTIKDSIEVVL